MTSGWKTARDVGHMALADDAYDLGDKDNHTFSTLFPIYDWEADDGFSNLGTWIEKAARKAGQ